MRWRGRVLLMNIELFNLAGKNSMIRCNMNCYYGLYLTALPTRAFPKGGERHEEGQRQK